MNKYLKVSMYYGVGCHGIIPINKIKLITQEKIIRNNLPVIITYIKLTGKSSIAVTETPMELYTQLNSKE